MKPVLVVAVVLIVSGILALAYGGFTYTKGAKNANIGPIEISVKDREHVSGPIWAGVASILVGSGLLLVPLTGPTGRAPTLSR